MSPSHNPKTVSVVRADKDQNDESWESLVISIIRGEQDYAELLQILEPNITTLSRLDSDTALQLALLLDTVDQHAELNDHLYSLGGDQGPPALLLSLNGNVLGLNASARSLFGDVVGKETMKLGIRESDFLDFKSRVFNHKGSSLLRVFPDRLQNTPLIFTGRYHAVQQIFLLDSLQCQWSESVDIAFKEIFKLTNSECEILACLSRGMKTEDIALNRKSQIGTVRQQIKGLLSKLGASSQLQAASLASSLANQYQNPLNRLEQVDKNLLLKHQQETSSKQSKVDKNNYQQGQVIRHTRTVAWRRYGKKNGHPVLSMHGAYFGAGDSKAEQQWAYANGLDVIVVERPGYGLTQAPEIAESNLDTVVEDITAVMNHVNWSQASIVSHDFGFVPALAFAHCKPECVLGFLAISPPANYQEDSDLSQIPHHQRAFIWAAQHAFWMIRLLLRLGHVRARKIGPKNWMNMAFEGAPNDISLFYTPKGQEISESAFHFNLNQNSKGHELDLQVCIATDWSELLESINISIVALAGQQNRTFDIAAVRELTHIQPNLKLQEIKDATLTLSVSHAHVWHKAIVDMINEQPKEPLSD